MSEVDYKALCTKQFFLNEMQRKVIYELAWVAHNYCHVTGEHPNDNKEIQASLKAAKVMIELNEDEATKKLVKELREIFENYKKGESQICDQDEK